MKNKKTLASVIGNSWFVSPEFVGEYLPMLSGFLQNKDLTPLFDTDTPVFSIHNSMIGKSNTNSSNRVGVINLSGIVFKNDQLCGPIGTTSMISTMKEWEKNKMVDSVLFFTSSPGGEASGTRRFAKFIKNYSLPTASYIDGVAGSAAYYIVSATDKVFMEPDADLVGSIGAMTSYKNINKYLEKQGIEMIDIYAESSFDKNLVSRKAKEGDFTLLQESLNPLAEKFENDVKSFRPNLKDEACHGKVYGPEEALNVGLIDSLGSFEDALSYLDSKSEKNTNAKKTTKMNNKYNALEAVLNTTFEVDDTKNGVLLSEEEAGKVDSKISDLQTELQTVTDAKKLVDDTISANTVKNTAIVDEVNTVLELEGDAKVTDVATAFTAMKNQIAELGKQPGETPTNLGENKQEDTEAMPEYVDLESSIYKIK